MEKLTNFELEQFEQQLINDGTDTQVRKLVDEVKAYRKLMKNYGIPNLEYLEQCIKRSDKYGELEEKIGCPLEVRCKLYNGAIVYDEDGKSMGAEHIGKHDFYANLIGGPYMPRLMYMKGYKKTWWLKKDKSE